MLFSLPARRTGKSVLDALLRPLTPAAYLRLRREAYGLSRHAVADRLAGMMLRRDGESETHAVARDRDDALALVDQLETPGVVARHRETIMAIGAIVPLDADVYYQLATEPAHRHPTVCRTCGCSDDDICSGDRGICTSATPIVCTACVEASLAQAGGE